MASSDSSDSDVDSSSSESSSGSITNSSIRRFRKKNFAERKMRDLNYFFDKFGRCEKCQEIYWEMRHTYNDDEMGGYFSRSWYRDDRYQQYEDDKISFIPYKEIMIQYRNKLLGCPDCPCNKDTPGSLRDQAYSCISRIIGTIAVEAIRKAKRIYYVKHDVDHKEYNRRVAELPVLDWMRKDLEAKPCEWECSHQRRICSTLMTFSDDKAIPFNEGD